MGSINLIQAEEPKMKIGEIYFIRERDRLDGSISSFVKIGMVNDVSRNSAERLLDHQTGNPRDLVLHHVTQTPGPFRVERFLHQQYGPQRIRSEWFRLTDEELAVAVNTCERLAEEAFIYIPAIEKAEELASLVSSSEKIAATDKSTQWIRFLSVAKAALKICKEMESEYKMAADSLSDEDRTAVEEQELVITEHYLTESFDKDGFQKRFPSLLEQYSETELRIAKKFTPKTIDVDLAEEDRELVQFSATFMKACEKVRSGELVFADLFDLRQILEQFSGTYSWNEDVATAQLKVICGTAAGIDGQVTWNRTAKEVVTLDKELLESEHPEKYQEFLTVKSAKRRKISRRAKKAAVKTS